MVIAIVETGTLNAIVTTGTLIAIRTTETGTGGVIISGQHAVSDLRGIGRDQPRKKKSRQQLIRTTGQVSFTQQERTTGRVVQETVVKFLSKLSLDESVRTQAKLAISRKVSMSARILKESMLETKSMPDHAGATKYLKDNLKREKLSKIKKLFKEYKDSQED